MPDRDTNAPESRAPLPAMTDGPCLSGEALAQLCDAPGTIHPAQILSLLWECRDGREELAAARESLRVAREALADTDRTLWALRDHCEGRGDVAGANTCNQLGFRVRAALQQLAPGAAVHEEENCDGRS